MTKTASATTTTTATKPTGLRAVFGLHAIPFTREIAIDDYLRLPFLDEAFAGMLSAVEARMSAALIAPAGTGKTALFRRLRAAPPEARYHVHYVKVTGLSKRDMCREIAVAAAPSPPAPIRCSSVACKSASRARQTTRGEDRCSSSTRATICAPTS